MKLVIDTDAQTLTTAGDGPPAVQPLYSKEAYDALSREWLRVGWSLRCYHNFSWLGLPVLQLPHDLVRVQEAIWQVRPDVIVETGVFRGGSLVFYASLCEAIGKGRVVGVDVAIETAVRRTIEEHSLARRMTLVEGDSAAPGTFARVAELVRPAEVVFAILDSAHAAGHVLHELELYSRLVTPGSYIVVTDGVMRDLHDVPGGEAAWRSDHPLAAASKFLDGHPEFRREPELPDVTYWPGGWLKRVR